MRDDQFSPDGPVDPFLEVLRRLWSGDASAPGRLGRFEVLRELGRGGMGIVFLASDPDLGCKVALKVPTLAALLSVGARRRFLNEAHAAARLDHPNIVPIREAGEEGLLLYIASAYCEGPTLAAWRIEQGGTLPPREAAKLVATLADAVEYMHGRGIFHRDLKPSNILLTPAADGPVPRITDFGLAKVRDGGDTTSTGPGPGTPAYMAPEQAAGSKSAGPTADVYSLGAILYELLAGRPPLAGPTPVETYRMVLAEEPPPLRRIRRGLPRDLEAICLKCLEKEPAKRYATAKELADDLRRFLVGEPTRVRPLSSLQLAARWGTRRWRGGALIMLATLVAVFLVALMVFLPGPSPERPKVPPDLAKLQAKYTFAIRWAAEYLREGKVDRIREHLNEVRPEPGQDDLRGFEWRYLWGQGTAPSLPALTARGIPVAVGFSADGKQITVAADGGPPQSWDAQTLSPLTPRGHADPSPRWLAMPAPDGLTMAGVMHKKGQDVVAVWDLATGKRLASDGDYPEQTLRKVAMSPDGKTVALFDSAPGLFEGVRLWTWESNKNRVPERLKGDQFTTAIQFSPDGRTLAVAIAPPSNVGPPLARRAIAPRLRDSVRIVDRDLVTDN